LKALTLQVTDIQRFQRLFSECCSDVRVSEKIVPMAHVREAIAGMLDVIPIGVDRR
jgi:hypothetical protein